MLRTLWERLRGGTTSPPREHLGLRQGGPPAVKETARGNVAPRPQELPHLIVAAAVFSGRARATEVAASGDLLTNASFWWAGTAADWEHCAQLARLHPLETLPADDDTLVMVVTQVTWPDGGVPTSRPEGASVLREAARNGLASARGRFGIADVQALQAAGFRR